MNKKSFLLVGLLTLVPVVTGCSDMASFYNKYMSHEKPKVESPAAIQEIVPWREDFEGALKAATAQGNKLVLIDFTAQWCSWCQEMNSKTFPDGAVSTLMKEFILVKVDIEKNKTLSQRYRINSVPTILFVNGSGQEISRIEGFQEPQVFATALNQILHSDQPPVIYQKEESGNLVNNGGFSDGYQGWTRTIGDLTKGNSKNEIIEFQEGQSKKALHLTHQGPGHIQYSQFVVVPGPDILFSVSFQANTFEGRLKAFSGSGVVQIGLRYLDHEDRPLGQTLILNYIKNPFADTPLIGVPRRKGDSYQEHFIEMEPGYHRDFQISIRQEIESNLLGVDASQVRKILIGLWCGATHPQASGELWVTDIALKPVKEGSI